MICLAALPHYDQRTDGCGVAFPISFLMLSSFHTNKVVVGMERRGITFLTSQHSAISCVYFCKVEGAERRGDTLFFCRKLSTISCVYLFVSIVVQNIDGS